MVQRFWRRSRNGRAEPSTPQPSTAEPSTGSPVATAEPPVPAPTEPPGAEPPSVDALLAEADRRIGSDGVFATIEWLRAANVERREPEIDARILRLRHEAFAALPPQTGRDVWPPQVEDRFAGVEGCPEVTVDQLDADVLASAVTRHGCLLVRNLVPPAVAKRLVETIDTAFKACDERTIQHSGAWPGSWYRPFRPGPGYPQPAEGHRGWVRSAGGVLAADSPPAFETMISAFEDAGLREVISGYLGERPIMSVDKCTLRRVPLDLGGAEWHQDGSFLGDGIRTLNVWLALSPCGGDRPSPGLDLVPKRFDALVPTHTDGAYFDWSVGHGLALRESADAPIIRPEFEAGDALLFDDLFLHRTALEPTMTDERYAIESWFFAGSCYPGDSTPVVF